MDPGRACPGVCVRACELGRRGSIAGHGRARLDWSRDLEDVAVVTWREHVTRPLRRVARLGWAWVGMWVLGEHVIKVAGAVTWPDVT